jgi:hypothetical protein
MKLLDILSGPFPAPRLTRTRMALAVIVALAADAVQVPLSPLGWLFFDEIIDIAVMALTVWAIGFHLLLLPTFLLEVLPGIEILPTWTGCVITVIILRKREQRTPPSAAPPRTTPPNPPDKQPVIDI